MQRNEKMRVSLLYKITTTFLIIIQKIKGQINFIGPVSSGKANFRPIGEGPLPEFFSICQSATECRLMNKTVDVWVNTTLNQAYIYSAQLVKKSFVTGFTSKVLDVSNLQPGGKPIERDTNPKKILRCAFTKGYRWICLDGDTGGYFTYNIATETKETTFDTSLSAKFGLLNNEDCSIVVENRTLYCAVLGPDQSKIIQLDQTNAGGLASYSGNLTVPANPAGSTSHRGIIGIFSVDNVRMRISNYSTGQLLFSWDKPDKADSVKSVADMNWGMMIITTADKSDIVKIKDGTVLKTIKAQTAEFSEVDKSFYFVDASNSNQDSYYQFTLPPIPLNCFEYHYGIERCIQCNQSYILQPDGNCTLNTSLPGNFIDTKDYEINFEDSVYNLLVVKFSNLSSLTNDQRLQFVRNFTNDTNFTRKFVVRHWKDPTWNVSDFMNFEPYPESLAWENGVLPIKVNHIRNNENFKGFFGLLTNGNGINFTFPNNTNLTNGTNSTNPNATNTTTPGTTPPATPAATTPPATTRLLILGDSNDFSINPRILQGSNTTPPQTPPNPLKNLSMPPFWNPSDGLKLFFRVLFDIMKFVINILQVYLIFIKPFGRVLKYDKWSSWFASSLQAMQIFLMLGGISGKFGGVIDAMKIEQLKSFQRNFFFDTEVNFSPSYKRIHSASLLEKFQLSGYTPSPIQETFWELLILLGSLLFQGIGMIVPSMLPTATCFRKGATNSLMIPLVLASMACLVALIKTNLSNIFGVLSLITSIFLLLYFVGEFLNLVRPCESMDVQRMTEEQKYQYKNKLLREGSYRCYDIDSLNNFNKTRPLNFFEYFLNMLTPIILMAFLFTGVGSVLSMFAIFIPKLILLLTQNNNREQMLRQKGWGPNVGSEIRDFNTLKIGSAGLNLLNLLILLLFMTFLKYGNLAWTQIFTVIGLFFVFGDYIEQFITLAKRFLGWGDAYERTTKMVEIKEERELERMAESRMRRGEEPPETTDRRRVIRDSNRGSPRESRRYPERRSYIDNRRDFSPGNSGNVRRLPPVVRRPDNGVVSPRGYSPRNEMTLDNS